MLRRIAVLTCAVIVAANCGGAFAASPKLTDWTDLNGTKFRGDPAEVVGPLALFRTGNLTARKVTLHLLSPEDCVRFHERVRPLPPRADDWAQAQGEVSRDLVGRVMRVEGDTLVRAELAGRREPQFFILFFATHSVGTSWEMMGAATPQFSKIQQDYPGMVEALFWGIGHTKPEHGQMATQMKMPWLVTNLSEQSAMYTVPRFAANRATGMYVVNRNGVPLAASKGTDKADVTRVMDELIALLFMMRPDNAVAAKERLHYWRAVQPVAFRSGHCPPMLVGDPVFVPAMREKSVRRFDATIQVAASGSVTGIRIHEADKLPPGIEDALKKALAFAIMVPAVTNGEFVDGEYEYHFEISP